jgi:Protein of unknown function (DUF559)
VIGDDANLPSPLAGEGRLKAEDRGYTPLALKRAKSLRKNQTEHERKLWQYVRGHRFADFKFRRQQPMGDYIVDFIYNELTNPSPGPPGHPLPQGEKEITGA